MLNNLHSQNQHLHWIKQLYPNYYHHLKGVGVGVGIGAIVGVGVGVGVRVGSGVDVGVGVCVGGKGVDVG